MLSEQYIRELEECNGKTDQSRIEELVQRYEDPVRATVHRVLEEYVERSFREFIGDHLHS